MASLATRHDVKRDTISRLLRTSGVPIRQTKRMTQSEINEAARLYEIGQSLAATGQLLGSDHQTIYRRLKKRSVVMRSPNDHQHPTSAPEVANALARHELAGFLASQD